MRPYVVAGVVPVVVSGLRREFPIGVESIEIAVEETIYGEAYGGRLERSLSTLVSTSLRADPASLADLKPRFVICERFPVTGSVPIVTLKYQPPWPSR